MPTTIKTATTKDIVIKSSTIILNDEQIKSLPSTQIEIVPALGVGKVIIPVDVTYVTNFAAAYSNVTAAQNGISSLFLQMSGDNIDAGIQTGSFGGTDYQTMQSFLETLGGAIWKVQPVAIQGINFFNYSNPWNLFASHGDNVPLLLFCSNPDGDFTGGDATNTFRISVSYVVVDL